MFYLTLNLQAKTLLLRGFKKFFRINSLLLVLEQNALLELAIDFRGGKLRGLFAYDELLPNCELSIHDEGYQNCSIFLNSIEYKESKRREMVAG